MRVAKRRKLTDLEPATGEIVKKTLTATIIEVSPYSNGGATYKTDGSVDLSVLTKGDIVEITGLDTNNNGTFTIDKVIGNNVLIDNPNAVSETGVSGTLTFNYEIVALHVKGAS